MSAEHVEPTSTHRATAPGDARRCRANTRWRRCEEPVVAEVRRGRQRGNWWAYCAAHLAEFNREVRDGRVWWKGWHP